MTHYIPTRRSSDLFELYGQQFVGLNGGPTFKFSEAISFMISCDDQAEVDYYWEKLTEGGQEQPCGWLDRKSTRLNSSTNAHLVCRLLLEKNIHFLFLFFNSFYFLFYSYYFS